MSNQMYKFSEYRKSDTRPTNRVFLWLSIATFFIVIMGIQMQGNLAQKATLQKEYQVEVEKNQQAEVAKVELTSKIDLLNDEEYILKLARNRYLMGLPQEIIFNMTDMNDLLKAEQNLLNKGE